MQNKHIKIVVDTNIVASALFFGGKPLDLIELILAKKVEATATPKIIEEYFNTIEYLLNKYKGKNLNVPLLTIVQSMPLIADLNSIKVCRDPDDDKFISCAVASESSFIVSGDKDLLVLEKYNEIKIISVADFFQSFKDKI